MGKDNPDEPLRVLLVAMVDSIHVARWMSQFDGVPVEFTVFPSTPNRRIHSAIAAMQRDENNPRKVSIPRWAARLSLLLGLIDIPLRHRCKGRQLRRLLRGQSFDLIHVLEFQHAGYIVNRALGGGAAPSTLIVTNWGSDIYWFSRFPRHRREIQKLLRAADFYSAECLRDWALARDLGFSGECLPVIPNAGGLDVAALRTQAELVRPSQRRRVMVKGYSGFVGLARTALAAVEMAAPDLAEYEICIYSASLETLWRARRLRRRTGLDIRVFRKGTCSHDEMLTLFSGSRIYLGMSQSDGISTSLLEAIACGCFPIQTGTACANEWIESGVSGYILGDDSASEAAKALRLAATDDTLVDDAFVGLMSVAEAGLDADAVKVVSRSYYATASARELGS